MKAGESGDQGPKLESLHADGCRPVPEPLPYHRAIVEHLRSSESGLWDWFQSTRKREDADALRLDLLKSTYRLDPGDHPRLYTAVEGVRNEMGQSCRVTLYQAQADSHLNASLAFLPGEAHIVFSGPIASALTEVELQAVLAHELAHFHLFEANGGHYLVAADLLRSLAADPAVGTPASESARLFSLWSEIYADRWSCRISGDATATVAALLKTETGLAEVNVASYQRQADEIFSRGEVTAGQVSHPELFIRARAVRLWVEQGDRAHAEIERMIEGGLSMERLDLLGQVRAADVTRRFLDLLLAPAWFWSEPVQAHARQFFPDFTPRPAPGGGDDLRETLARGDRSLRDYFCYLLLDFATVDRELGDVGLSAAIVTARRLGLDDRFTEIAQQELGIGKKAFAKIANNAESLVERTGASSCHDRV